MKVLAGRELGFGPIASMTGVNVIKGRVSLSANLIASLVKRSGRYDYQVKVLNDDECTIEFYEGQTCIGVSTFTMQDAKTAQLTGGDNWKKYARNMLFARAVSNGARWYCPDVFGGAAVYAPDELGLTVDEDGQVIDVQARNVMDALAESGVGDGAHGADQAGNGSGPGANGGGAQHVAESTAALWASLKADLAARYECYRGPDGQPDSTRIKEAARALGYQGVPHDEVGMRELIAALEQEAAAINP